VNPLKNTPERYPGNRPGYNLRRRRLTEEPGIARYLTRLFPGQTRRGCVLNAEGQPGREIVPLQ